MFKDYSKYLKESLRVYIFVLILIFILKIVGLDYFGLDTSNPTIVKISNFISSSHLGDIYNFVTVYIMFYFFLCLTCDRKGLYKKALIGSLLNFIPQCFINTFFKMDWLYQLLCILITLIFPKIVDKKVKFRKIIKYIILINVYQLISMFIRNVGINSNYSNFLVESILNIDQLLMLAITYNIHFMKGGNKLCGVEVEVGSSLQKKNHFTNLLKNLQRNYSNFKKYSKQDKATIIIYSLLSLIWNIFTVIVVLFVAKLNDTFIECIFIITSFWLSKKVFGKPFHLKSMIGCFVLSNLTYYVLNRITTPIGISIIIPVMLGVGLSYLTSKLVRKAKPLYKGMSEDDFNNSILKVVDENSDKYKICYDFFIKKENAISLGYKYNYTEAGIRKIAARINEKIKTL